MAKSAVYSNSLPNLSVRGSEGVYILSPSGQSGYSQLAKFNSFQDEYKNAKFTAFDSTGRLFAYTGPTHVKLIDMKNECKLIASIDKPRTSYLKFSPLGTYLVLWETFYINKEDKKEVKNLNIYETSTGTLFMSMVYRKNVESAINWTNDESVYGILVNSEVQFYEKEKPGFIAHRLKVENLASFSMSPMSKCVAVHASGKKGQPSNIRLFQYPNFTNVLANKSFFNAHSVEYKWNKSGYYLLLLCTTETSANSYYGDSTLHQISPNGESQLVQLSKKGPIYSIQWNPVKDEFIVVYGTMPAKVTLFNAKCDAVYEFGTGSRNDCYYSPHGNILCLAGFGNLRGRIEMWNLTTQNKVPQELCSVQADDTTWFEWCPDGEHVLTATTSPRLRVSNGFKILNYAGEIKYSYLLPKGHELWQVQFQPGNYIQPKITMKKSEVIVKDEPKAYVPPHLRGANNKAPANFNSKLHADDEKADTKLKIKPNEKKVLDPAAEKEKKIRNLKKKIAQIEDLKKKQKEGVVLEKNQVDKIKSEDDLIEELEKLEL